jgi:hypothetical protein
MDALEALALLRRELDHDTEDVIPYGWRTARGWAEAWGLSRPHTATILADGAAAGRVEKQTYRLRTETGVRRIPH